MSTKYNFNLMLVRHGETTHNKDKLIQGQLDIPLSAIGIRQATCLGTWLENRRFSHAFSSDLARAKETAENILARNVVYKTPIVEDSRLREKKFGEMEGKHISIYRQALASSNLPTSEFKPAGAETNNEVRQRAISYFKDLCDMLLKENQIKTNATNHATDSSNMNGNCDNELKSVLVVSHGGLLREFMYHLTSAYPCTYVENGASKKLSKTSPNAGISEFLITIENSKVTEVNCLQLHITEHLVDVEYIDVSQVNHVEVAL